MNEIITRWITNTFTTDPKWITAILSVIPLVETRGAITVGMELGLQPFLAWAIACASAFLVSPILFFGTKPLLQKWKQGKFFTSLAQGIEETFRKKAEKIEKGKNRSAWKKTLGVFLFVAIPLPLTGLWTGSIVAAFVDLDAKHALSALFIGDLTSGLIILLLNYLFGEYAWILLFILFGCIIVSLFVATLTLFKKIPKNENNKHHDPNTR